MLSKLTRTADELAELKAEWTRDPIWQLEDSAGFEEHKEELMAYRQTKEVEWARERLAMKWMIPGITYREWIAGRCLAALATAGGAQTPKALAERAVALTDALVKRLQDTALTAPH